MAPPFQVLCNQSNKVKLVFVGVLLFKFIFIKSWNFNRNENGEASPWCLGLLWDTRWVSVLVVIFPAKLFFYRRVIDGSASFGDTCKDQMASVSRRVPLLLIDFLWVKSCSFHQYFLALSLFWGWWTWMKLLATDISTAGMSSPFSLKHLSTMWCLVLCFFLDQWMLVKSWIFSMFRVCEF